MKICKTCNIEKELDEFYNNKLNKDGKTIHCIECVKQYKIDNPKTEEQKERTRINRSAKKRGITVEEVLLEEKLIKEAQEKGLKLCYSCMEQKELTEFSKQSATKDGLLTICKVCKNKQTQEHYKNNVDHISNQKNEYRKENIEKVRVRQNKWRKNKRNTDPLFKFCSNIRSRTKEYLRIRKFNEKFNKSTYEIIGCTPEELIKHFESLFTEGMSWELMGKHIHIDHIIPLSSAKTYEDVIRLSHYTNLQPLWATDNLKKGARIL